MKLQDVTNIWTVDPSTLSNVVRGQVYFARISYLVDQFFAKPRIPSEMIDGNRFCRSHLRKVVGCGSATLSQNRQIKALLDRADNRLAAQRALAQLPKRGRHMRDLEISIEGLRVRIDEQERKLAELYDLLGSQAKQPTSDRQLTMAVNELNRNAAKRPK